MKSEGDPFLIKKNNQSENVEVSSQQTVLSLEGLLDEIPARPIDIRNDMDLCLYPGPWHTLSR